ncbi:MAG: hypothetical protein IPP07_05520 [Holophagales bacterium]|nr:hypothetical protein [Holophagales bacterium]MBK9964372.1 hypothetical protein [Holophagales bacterium]
MLDTALLLVLAALPVPPPAAGPPVDLLSPVVHDVTMSIDVGPARDTLTLLAGGPDAPQALQRLKGSRAFHQALSRGGGNPDDVLGRLVSVAAGTPDPLLGGYSGRAAVFRKILDALETDGTPAAMLEARRIAALLPSSRPVTARLRLVPLFGLSRFGDVVVESDGETTWLFADLPGLAPEGNAEVVPREVVFSVLRTAASESWTRLFAPFRVPPAWPEPKVPDFDALLARTAADGPATMFLFADEFFPLGTMFEEPIQRSFDRWNTAAEVLLDPKAKEATRREALAAATARGEFWSRHSSVVGVKMTEVLLRSAGAARYLEALAAGPRAVAALYLEVTRKGKEPALGKAARKALEAKPPSS